MEQRVEPSCSVMTTAIHCGPQHRDHSSTSHRGECMYLFAEPLDGRRSFARKSTQSFHHYPLPVYHCLHWLSCTDRGWFADWQQTSIDELIHLQASRIAIREFASVFTRQKWKSFESRRRKISLSLSLQTSALYIIITTIQ